MAQYIPLLNYESIYEIQTSYPYNIRRIANKHIIKPWFDNNTKYLRITLRKNNKNHNHKIHRLIALQFIPNTNNCKYACFKDSNRANININNIYWSNNTTSNKSS